MVAYLAMSGWGVTFTVHPQAFVVHMPHLEAKTKNMTKELGIYWTGVRALLEMFECPPVLTA